MNYKDAKEKVMGMTMNEVISLAIKQLEDKPVEIKYPFQKNPSRGRSQSVFKYRISDIVNYTGYNRSKIYNDIKNKNVDMNNLLSVADYIHKSKT